MAYDRAGAVALDYLLCRYGQSRLLFRGPRRRLEGAYGAVLGGSETYGKFVAEPYPALTEAALGLPMVNFGYLNAGVDVFVNDPVVLDACSRSRVTVVQLLGAHNMSNRFYAVHPRRNDRFLRASGLLRTIFRDVDFTEFHFTRHLLVSLKTHAPERFAVVEDELRAAWVARMRLLLQKVRSRTVLLWLQGREAPAQGGDPLGPDPVLIDAEMVAAIRPHASDLVVVPSDPALAEGTDGMVFAPLEAQVAAQLPNPRVHRAVAEALVPALRAPA